MKAPTPMPAGSDAVVPRIVASGGEAMVFDAGWPGPPTRDWFDPAWWQARGQLQSAGGGRGGVAFLDAPGARCVLRHYRRGGMVTPILGDRYLWQGRSRTRSFAEFHLLAEMHARGLPVPAPVAARCRRRGAWYTADLITRAIDGAQPLSAVVAEGRLDAALAARVGALVARFHAAGVDHADLNAHNILLANDVLWLIDFDRGELRASGTAWKLGNLARLKRSLLKVGACDHDVAALDRGIWAPLMHGYQHSTGRGG